MSRLAFLLSGTFVLACAQTLRTQPPELSGIEKIHRGMSRPEVKKILGHPVRISRQILLSRHLEQWHYEEPPRWVEFDCRRGEEGFVAQTSHEAKSP